ncbi:hypothetical protein J5N97_029657 [Dioscorea zingiberensis]|uniref:Eukaryotic translation initiation factor 4G n=1 Tax=Dioscorea zingiberensis TaxID=325984 RepID=A0A9D5BVT0_9LILI|nr:hypothetical protein J5N97_029657 [Dioscorea zingiberensis]
MRPIQEANNAEVGDSEDSGCKCRGLEADSFADSIEEEEVLQRIGNSVSKKSGNVQQYRVNQVGAGSDVGAAVSYQAANRAVQNGSSDAPTTSGAKLVDSSRNSRTLPKAPPPQSAAGASDSAAPLRPAKGMHPISSHFSLGTISPGIMNGMQDSSSDKAQAPPNLDEQKSDQARHDSFRAMPTLPLPAAPKQQQQTRKDVGVTKQSSPGESHPQTQTKKEVHMQNPPAPTVALPKPSVLPVTGTPMPVSMPFQQPQVSLQFCGPGIQFQSQGVTAGSVQMPLTFPVGGAPQVPQQMFVSALQSHPMQPQAIMHQGQGFSFAPQIGHQLPSQLGNLGIAIGPQFGPQQPGKFGGTSPISEVCVESNLQQSVPVSEPSVTKSLPVTNRQSAAPSDSLLLQRSEHECSSAALVTPVRDPVAVAVGTGGRKREPITRSNSLKEYQKKPSKKDMGHMQQQQHQDTLNSVSVETSGAVEDEAVLALPTPTAVVLEKETTPNANLCCSYESTPNMIGIPTMEGDSAETSTSVVLNDDGIVRQSLDSTLSQTEHDLVEVGPKSEVHASQDTAGTEDSDKSATCLTDDAEKQQLEMMLQLPSKIISHRDVDTSDHAVPLPEATIRQIPFSLGTGQNREGKAADLPSGNPVTVAHSGPKDKPTLEPPRAKTASGKKKLLKEILLKADSNAADISTLKLGTSENNHHAHGATKHADEYGNEATGRKKYSRDFLMTLSEQCMELPAGFEIGYDIANSLMTGPVTASYAVDREPHPSPGRSIDRSPRGPRVDRRMVGVGDDDKWSKLPGSSGPGHDLRLDIGHGAPAVSFRPGQGVNHGVLRNPRGQSSNQYAGGILSGPIQAMASPGGVPQNGIDADRWHRAPSAQRGLIPSPQTPLQVMHKATRKYEVGKVSDVEQAKQRQLKSILNKLTPQNFEKLFAQVKEVNIDNLVTLTGVISQIFDKALMEPTFCEMYADFCYHLSAELPDFSENNEKITFKRLLLNKCQEEFERGEREQAEADKADEEGEIQQTEGEREEKRIKARRRMLGNIRLIGELYKKKMLTERIMHECIKKLLGQYQNPDEEDLEALCKLMSTIGQMIDHSKAKEHMDAYFDMMLKLSTNQKLSSRVRFMLRDAIDLRKNRWQQRRKIEGPKKIEEDVRVDDRHPLESKTLSSLLPQRPTDDDAITLGPKGGLGRGMTIRGQPLISNAALTEIPSSAGDPRRRTATGPNGYSAVSCNSRDEVRSRDMLDRLGGTSYEQSSFQRTYSGSRDSNITDHTSDRPSLTTSSTGRIHGSLLADPITSSSHSKPLSEEGLRDKSMSAIREYYSAKDDEEVVLCIKELNSTNFYPTMISLWITDSFERKDMERDLLARLLVKLNKSQEHVLSETQLIQGFENVLSSLEDAMNDAPKAAEFLGRLFAKVILESAVPLKEVGRLILKGGEEPGHLLETGVASEVLGSILESIQNDKGDSILNEIRTNSGLRLEDFRPPQPLRAKKLEPFL